MSAIVPSRRVGMTAGEPLGGLAGEEAAGPLGVADRAGGDRVDADAERAPLDGQGARQGVDRRLRRGDVELAGRPAVVQRRADVQDRAAVVLEPGVVRGPGDVPGPLGVDVEDGRRSRWARGRPTGRGSCPPRR